MAVTLRKYVLGTENTFIQMCRDVLGDMTGENFSIAAPEWMITADGVQLEIDGYNDRLKMAIDYQPTILYQLPPPLYYLYDDIDGYFDMLQYLEDARIVLSTINHVALIHIPCIMSEESLRNYLGTALHTLTRFRAWVGSPARAITS